MPELAQAITEAAHTIFWAIIIAAIIRSMFEK